MCFTKAIIFLIFLLWFHITINASIGRKRIEPEDLIYKRAEMKRLFVFDISFRRQLKWACARAHLRTFIYGNFNMLFLNKQISSTRPNIQICIIQCSCWRWRCRFSFSCWLLMLKAFWVLFFRLFVCFIIRMQEWREKSDTLFMLAKRRFK